MKRKGGGYDLVKYSTLLAIGPAYMWWIQVIRNGLTIYQVLSIRSIRTLPRWFSYRSVGHQRDAYYVNLKSKKVNGQKVYTDGDRRDTHDFEGYFANFINRMKADNHNKSLVMNAVSTSEVPKSLVQRTLNSAIMRCGVATIICGTTVRYTGQPS